MKALEILDSMSIRLTPAREAILEILLDERCPMSYREVAARLPKEMDRVTLYRTLLLLLEKGIVHRVMDMKGTWRFCAHSPSATGCPGNHPHFICRICGRMTCLTGSSLPHLEVESGAVVEGKHMVVYGICAQCARRFGEERGRER
ncbi:MAG: transcriptional repressor [Thermovirga sp.]